MIKTLLIALLLVVCNYATAATQIVRVIDGDTVEVTATWLPKELGTTIRVRVLGVDTPEKLPRAKCDKEAALGAAATAFTKATIANATKVTVTFHSWDKFGGRILGDVIVDDQSLRTLLITKGFAREYRGEKKQSWCD